MGTALQLGDEARGVAIVLGNEVWLGLGFGRTRTPILTPTLTPTL
jgi:hypothetical protein